MAKLTPGKLIEFKKERSAKVKETSAARIAKMTPEERVVMNRERAEYGRAWRASRERGKNTKTGGESLGAEK